MENLSKVDLAIKYSKQVEDEDKLTKILSEPNTEEHNEFDGKLMANINANQPDIQKPVASTFSMADIMTQLKMPEYKEGNGLETIKGTEKDSHFLIIAKKSGLKIGIRPLVFVIPQNEVPFLILAFRLRVEPFAPDGNVLLASKTFGILLNEKTTHASLECGVKLVQMPCSPSHAFKVWQDNLVTQELVGQLITKLEKENVQLIATPDQIVEYLNLVYEAQIPNTVSADPTEFNIVYGIKPS